MFCEKCGTQVADGQAFCPSCGTPIGAAPQQPAAPTYAAAPAPQAPAYSQAPAYGYAKPPRAIPPRRPGVNLMDNFKAMTMMEKLYLLGALCGFMLTFFLFQLPTIKYAYYSGVVQNMGWLLVFTNLFHVVILGTLLLTFVGALKNALFHLVPVAAGGVALLMFVISWIANSYYLSVAGWFYFILIMGAIASGVMFFLEEKKNGY